MTAREKYLIKEFLELCRKKRFYNKGSQTLIDKSILSALNQLDYTPIKIAEIEALIRNHIK